MSSTFWVNAADLDAEQRQAVQNISEASSYLLKGPAGSGKTNILLLRAKWLTLKKQSNFKIVVFTGSLKNFVEIGCSYYGIDPGCAVTQMTFLKTILQEYSVPFERSDNFETERTMLAGKVLSLIEAKRISGDYCGALLVDEAQDYTDTELLVFRGLTKRLVLASDSRQSIYRATHTPGLPEDLVSNNVVTLRYHYRSGLQLCKVADGILTDTAAYPRVQSECRYPEGTIPSSVTAVPCGSFEAQMEQIAANLQSQLALYPDERLGVLFPTKEQLNQFVAYVVASPIQESLSRLRLDTLHGAKGWEFRAVHIGGCETLPKMGPTQKRLIYTGILRGRTSAHLYYSGRLPGYLEAAIAVLEPPRLDPTLDDLF